MKIAVVGPGAIGSLFAAYLSEGGLDVTVVDHRPERAEFLSRVGLVVEGVRGEHHAVVRATADASSLGNVELVLLCVKAHQTTAAVSQHLKLIGPDTALWSLQNGLGNVEAAAAAAPEAQVLGGSTSMAAYTAEDGRILHTAEGETYVGELAGRQSHRAEAIAALFSSAGIAVQASEDIRRVMWQKLLINVGLNALTAILQVPNGQVLENPAAARLLEAAVREAVAVAGRHGMRFDPREELDRVHEVARRTAQNRSSMLMDLKAGRRTEIDAINGAVAVEGIAPINSTLADLVRSLEGHPLS